MHVVASSTFITYLTIFNRIISAMESRLLWTTLVLLSGVVDSSDYHLVIIHQSDIHATYIPVDKWALSCRNATYQKTEPDIKCIYGGFPRAVAYVKQIKEDPYSPNIVSVNSGDFFKGDYVHIAFKGEIASSMASHMPYEAITIGDKDFSEGIDELIRFMRNLSNVFICTNMDFGNLNNTVKEELLKLCPRHRIVTSSGTKIAMFGYLKPDSVSLSKLGGIRLEDEFQALNREVAVVQEQGVHILIALGHSGYERDKEIAVQVPGLDVIVGGHSHSLLWNDIFSELAVGRPADSRDEAVGPYPTVVRTGGRVILIVHSYWAGKYVGNINVTFDDSGEVKDWWPQPALMRPGMPEDPGARSTLDNFLHRLEEWSRIPVGFSYVQLVGLPTYCNRGECSMGNLITDAMLWALRVDAGDENIALPTVAIANAGSIRNSLPIGHVTIHDMDTALPFRNKIHVIAINGSNLWDAFEHSVSVLDYKNLLQVSGARVVYNVDMPPHHRLQSVDLLCQDCPIPAFQPLNRSRMYLVACPDWIGSGKDGFVALARHVRRYRELIDIDLLERYLRHMTPIYPALEQRFTFINNQTVDALSGVTRAAAAGCLTALAVLLSGAIHVFV